MEDKESQKKLFNTNRKGEDILGDQENDGHSEAGTDHWCN
jgi:hypothetical protein